jgi:GH35 family endo-1,4-beta-xylanase
MKFPLLLTAGVALTLSLIRAVALDLPAGGTDLGAAAELQASAGAEVGRVTILSPGKSISVTTADPARPYAAQFGAHFSGGAAAGDRLVAVIRARTVGEEKNGELIAKLQLREAPYTAFAPTAATGVIPEWRDLPVTLVADGEIPAGKASIVLFCGHREQHIEVGSIRLFRYPATTDLALLPRAKAMPRSYEGREPEAPWRKAALERIEQHRKADLSLTVTGPDGKPLPDKTVSLSLRRHEFGFGSAVVAARLSGGSEDDRRYREIIDRLFSIVVFENDLKDGNWSPDFSDERRAARNEELDKAFAWLAERKIGVRGHYLMQVATPYNLQNITDPDVIRDLTLASVRERLEFVKDRVTEWDAINHPVAWEGAAMLNQIPGLESLDRDVFTLGRSLTKLPFFVNEDQIFRPGPQCDDTYTYIESLIADGHRVDGLGNQAHFHESYLPSPEHLLAVTDRFAALVPHQSITEYDIVTTDDEALAADYTRDVLIAVFSHPAYTSFLFWGFWEGSHWIPAAASWNRDWSIRPRGEVIEEWIGKRWHTALEAQTDEAGKIAWRGFPGWYEVTIDGQRQLVELSGASTAAILSPPVKR